MSTPTPPPSGTPVASSPPSSPPTTTPAPSQTTPPPPPTTTPAPSSQTPPAPPPSVSPSPSPPPPPLSSPPLSPLPSPPPPSVSVSAPAPSSPSTTSSPPPPPSSVASPPPPKSSTPSPSTASSPPPPPSSVASPPPPKSSTPSSSTSPPPPRILTSPPPPPIKSTITTASTSSSSPPSPASSISGSSLIAIGVAGLLAISVIAVLLFCLCKKKKKKKYYPGEYYGPPGGPPSHYKDSYYAPNMRQQEWCSPSSNGSDVLIKIPPPPVPPSLPSSRNGYDPIPPAPNSGGSPGLGNSKSWFTYGELATATGGFSKSNMLGEGGFGCVYKGVLTDGQLVAVKQLKVGASQGEKEFQAEVEIISRVHHRHLVSLVGYCIAESQRLLVYDYVPNGTLEYHLHKKTGPVMDWATRIKIACGAARGLAYLHEDCHPRIIHRDIKSSNILLDNNFEAQVSDFGLAKLTSDTNTHVTTRVMGTFGYLAPEYASSGKLTDKSDVFSFGVVLLELLTGRKPVDPSQPLGEESLVEWARPVLAQVNSEDDLKILADPSLNDVYDLKEMMRMVEAAAACVRHSANKRPRMGQVVRALEDETSLSDLNKDLKPGHSSMYGSSFASTDYDNASYSANMRRFRRVALESQEYGSECSGATSEYGVNPSVSSSEYQTSTEIDRNLSQLTKPMSVRKNILSSNSNDFSTRN